MSTTSPAASALPKGLILDILRGQYDCTNHGVTAREFGRTSLTLVGYIDPKGDRVTVHDLDRSARVFAANDERPAVALSSNMAGTACLVPVEPDGQGTGWVRSDGPWMAGGHFAETCDSRFGQAVADYLHLPRFYGALKVHDRTESAALSAALSQ
jgi:hypothetical protein